MTFNTGNPVGSTDARDMYDNAQNFDKFSLGQDLEYPDRLGVPRKSLAGIRAEATDALSRLGYQVLGDYAADLVVQNYGQVFRKDGEFYRAKAELTLPYTLNGNWAEESASFVSVGDAVLRQSLDGSPLAGDGAAMVSGAAIVLDSVLSLTQVAAPKDGRSYSVSGYRQGSTKGGGTFIWRASLSKSVHDGVTIIDPAKTFPSDFNDTGQVSAWFTAAGSGTGVFVKEYAVARSGYEAGMADAASAGDRWMLSALLDSLNVNGGCLAILPGDVSFNFPYTVTIPGGISLDLNGSTVTFSVTGSAQCFVMSSSSSIYNGTVNVVGTSATGGGQAHSCISGGSSSTGAGVSRFSIHDLELSTNRTNGNAISMLGDCSKGSIYNIHLPSSPTLGRGIQIEWSGTASGTGHPHDIQIKNITAGVMGYGAAVGSNAFIVWISSAFNITVDDVFAESCYGVVGIAAGDYANDYAPARYKRIVGTGIKVNGAACHDCKLYGVRVNGSAISTTTTLDLNPTISNVSLSGGNSGVGILCEYASNARIENADVSGFDNGITLGNGSRSIAVDGGRMHMNKGNGIRIGYPDNNVYGCTVTGAELFHNNQGGYSGVGGAAAIFVSGASRTSVKDCSFGRTGETQQYSIRIDGVAYNTVIKDNHTSHLASGGFAYVNGASTEYDRNTVGENNSVAAGISISGGAPVYKMYHTGRREFSMSGSTPPTSGAWERGDKCFYTLPSASGSIGAVCVVAGTPGTWKNFGSIAA